MPVSIFTGSELLKTSRNHIGLCLVFLYTIGMLYICISVAILIFLDLDAKAKYAHRPRYFKACLVPLCVLLYVYGRLQPGKPLQLPVVLGFLFDWLGDMALLGKGKRAFRAGTLFFLLGHVFFLLHFVRHARLSGFVFIWCLYIVYGYLAARHLHGHIPEKYKKLCAVYGCVLVLMAAMSILQNTSGIALLLYGIGTGSFLISDTLIAHERFIDPEVHGVMETYVLAQYCIAFGCLLS